MFLLLTLNIFTPSSIVDFDQVIFSWVNDVKKLLKKIERLSKIEIIEEMILSQEDQPVMHSTPADITCEPNIDRGSVSRVGNDQDLDLRPLSKRKA